MKKKLQLQIDKLRVEQFKVQQDSTVAGGTVHAFQQSWDCFWHSHSIREEACVCLPLDTASHC